MTQRRAPAKKARRKNNLRRTTKPNDPRNRLVALLVIFIIVGASLVAALVDLQAVRPDRYRSLGEDQRTRTRTIAGYRGAVVDRNGFVLAASTPSHQIVADPTLVEDPARTGSLLAEVLDIEAETLTEKLTPTSENNRFSLLARDVDDDQVSEIQGLDLSEDDGNPLQGISIVPEEDRVYPAGPLANQLVGRVDPDEQGIFGIELQYDEVMTGVPGSEQFERGRFGSISVGDWKVDPATVGDNVVLTIDHRIQFVAEQSLLEHCEATKANGATAVMSDPRSGEILAMASVVRSEAGDCEVAGYNTALIDTFEPGSVMKPLVIAAVTEELGYSSETVVEVPPRLRLGGKTFVDHPAHPAAPFPVSQILSNSMNVGTILLSQRIPADTTYGYLLDFGLSQPSGLEWKGESSGSLRSPDEWWGADYGSIPIGQGMVMNATQLLRAYNVFANGGERVDPTLIRAVEGSDGELQSNALPDRQRVLSERTATEITSSLRAVVTDGTGKRAEVPGYDVVGKTGTAWKVFDDGSGKLGYGEDGNRRYIVTFAGFLPAQDPQLSMVVVVDEPTTDTTAGLVAAPIFAELADYAVRILDIAPVDGVVDDGSRVRAEPAGYLADGTNSDSRGPGQVRPEVGAEGSTQ